MILRGRRGDDFLLTTREQIVVEDGILKAQRGSELSTVARLIYTGRGCLTRNRFPYFYARPH